LEHSEHIGKFIGPADPALIAGASKYVNPWATRAAIVPAFICFAAALPPGIFLPSAFQVIGMEARGRTIEELHAELTRARAAKIPAH